MHTPFQFRKKTPGDNSFIREIASRIWGSVDIISKDQTHSLLNLPGYIGIHEGKPAGFVAYAVVYGICEIVALYSNVRLQGLGTALIDLVKNDAKKDGCRSVRLITTNDNLRALRFYQKRGFTITAVRMNIMEKQRRIKPTIPQLGEDGIPIRDEIELSISL